MKRVYGPINRRWARSIGPYYCIHLGDWEPWYSISGWARSIGPYYCIHPGVVSIIDNRVIYGYREATGRPPASARHHSVSLHPCNVVHFFETMGWVRLCWTQHRCVAGTFALIANASVAVSGLDTLRERFFAREMYIDKDRTLSYVY